EPDPAGARAEDEHAIAGIAFERAVGQRDDGPVEHDAIRGVSARIARVHSAARPLGEQDADAAHDAAAAGAGDAVADLRLAGAGDDDAVAPAAYAQPIQDEAISEHGECVHGGIRPLDGRPRRARHEGYVAAADRDVLEARPDDFDGQGAALLLGEGVGDRLALIAADGDLSGIGTGTER